MAMAARLGRLRSLDTFSGLKKGLCESVDTISRGISTCSSNLILKQSPKSNFSVSKPFLSHHLVSAQAFSFSNGRLYHSDPCERYKRRTAINWGIQVVPQQEAYVIERFGKFQKVLGAGIHLAIPIVDKVAYIHPLKEQTIDIPEQPAVTTDNVSIRVNGVLFVKVIDAEKASYGNDNVMVAVIQLAQTVMRSCIGKMPLDKTFMERDTLNANIVQAINAVASQWGLSCRRYEIRDIIPPPGIRESMEKQAEAERNKRAAIIEAEGKRQAVILTAEAAKTDTILKAEAAKTDIILKSEAAKMDEINRATGEAEAILIRSKATAEALNNISEALQKEGGQAAASLRVAEDYVQAFGNLAQKSTTVLLPSNVDDASTMVAKALTLYQRMIPPKA